MWIGTGHLSQLSAFLQLSLVAQPFPTAIQVGKLGAVAQDYNLPTGAVWDGAGPQAAVTPEAAVYY